MAGKTNFAFQQQNCRTLWNDGAWLNFFQEYSYYWGLRLEPRVSIIFQEYSYTWAGETYKEIATYKPDMTGEHTKWKIWSPGLYGKFLWLAALSFSYWYWKSVGTVATLYKPINIYKPCLISELAKKRLILFQGCFLPLVDHMGTSSSLTWLSPKTSLSMWDYHFVSDVFWCVPFHLRY